MRWWPRRRRAPRPEPRPLAPEGLATNPQMIVAALARHGVDYVMIGGIAVQGHGSPRTTGDVDLVAGSDPDNLQRLGAALIELQAGLRGVDAHLLGIDPTDPQTLRSGANFTLNTLAGPLDVWTDTDTLKGSPPWPELSARSLVARVGEAPVRIAARRDLVSMKRAAARVKDLEDITFLTRTERGLDPPGPSPQRRREGPNRERDDPERER